jgi:hypothetical protein
MATKMVNGVLVTMTAEEEAQFEADRTPTLAHAKKARKQAILVRWGMADAAGFTYQTKTIESDATNLARISVLASRARRALADSEAFSVVWVTADDSTLTLNRAELIDMDKAAGDFLKRMSDNARTLRQAVSAATDLAGVAAVNIEAGW